MYDLNLRIYAIYELKPSAKRVAIRNVIRNLNRTWHLKLNMDDKNDQISAEALALRLCSAFMEDGSMMNVDIGN